MATTQRSKPRKLRGLDEVSPSSSVKLRARRQLQKKIDDPVSVGMSLDVLAQVASETLENEPNSPQKIKPKKLSMRTIHSLEVLTLEQILGLTEKNLVNMFSDVESNEMRRNFTYTCYLMPKQCKKQFTSFGSEMKAHGEIKKHLYRHLDELTKEANSPSRKTKFKFTAEPVGIRKKRIYDILIPATKKKKSKQAESNLKQSNSDKGMTLKTNNSNNNSRTTEMEWDLSGKDTPGSVGKSGGSGNAVVKTVVRRSSRKLAGKQLPVLHNVTVETPSEIDKDTDATGNDEAERRIEENEQFIIDLLSKTQPHHDHNYTTIFGRRRGSEIIHHLMDESDEEQQEISASANTVVYLDKKGNKAKRKAKPILFLRHRSPNENVPMVSKEEIITEYNTESDTEEDELARLTAPHANLHTGQKPYPPIPKARSCNVGPLDVFQEPEIPEDVVVKKKKKITNANPINREGREGNLGWEPKLAMKFIRELKGKKKNENIPLVCKICRDKTFTATATLMYHYRSHAGIKPFVCLICKTTFTRQHSLNYHMLIHNNQSRFTCKDCGRKFRHPSHFKEHLRRHTGETPFECADCGQKFKTRNTYKRHLKTRHGKLLTATGISQMTREEFLKVRTKPYKIPRLPSIGYKMPELTFSEIKNTKIARRQKEHIDSEEFVDVDEILKTVDEIKKEIESDSETESEKTESALSESPNSSVAQETEQRLALSKAKVPKASRSTLNVLESVYKSSTLSVLESVCAEVLTGKSAQMEFMEVTPKQTAKVTKGFSVAKSKTSKTVDIAIASTSSTVASENMHSTVDSVTNTISAGSSATNITSAIVPGNSTHSGNGSVDNTEVSETNIHSGASSKTNINSVGSFNDSGVSSVTNPTSASGSDIGYITNMNSTSGSVNNINSDVVSTTDTNSTEVPTNVAADVSTGKLPMDNINVHVPMRVPINTR